MNQRRAGAILSYINMGVNTVVNLLYVPLLLYYIGQNEYGLYKLLASFIAYFGVMDFGLNAAFIRFYTRYLTLKDTRRMSILLGMAFRFYLLIIVLIILIGTVLFIQLDDFFSGALSASELQEAHYIFILLVCNIVFSFGSQIHITALIAHERFVLLKGSALLRVVLQPLLIICVLQFYQNALAVVAIQTLFNLANTLIYIWYARNRLKIKAKYNGIDKDMLKEMKNLALSVLVVFIVDQIFWQTNQIVLGMYTGTATVAVYAIASQIYMNYYQFSTIIPGMMGPKITAMVTLDATAEALSEQFIKIGRLQYIILLGVVSGFYLFGKEFICLWAGDSFVDAYWIALFIIVPFTIDLVQNLGLSILQAQNRYGFRAVVYCFAGLVNLLLVFMIAKVYGGIGCALVTGTVMFISNGLIMNIYYARYINLKIIRFWLEIGKISLAAIPVLLIGNLLNVFMYEDSLLVYVLKLILFMIVYYCIIYKLAMNCYERDLFSMVRVMRKLHIMG